MIEIETPELDEISTQEWFTTKYSYAQKKEISTLLDRHIWVTARRMKINVREMSTAHINNCINCFNGKGSMRIPEDYLGGREKWIKIFNNELINRS